MENAQHQMGLRKVLSMKEEPRDKPTVRRNTPQHRRARQPSSCTVALQHGDVAEIKSVPTPTRSSCSVIQCDSVDVVEMNRISEILSVLKHPSEVRETLQAMTELRRVLASVANPPVQEVLVCGGAEVLVKKLRDQSAAVQFEAAWALTNMTSGSRAQIAVLLHEGMLEALFAVLRSDAVANRAELCDQCLWVLGNVAGERCAEMRDQMLGAGVVDALGELYSRLPDFVWFQHDREKVLRTLTWLMSGLCCGQPAPPLEEVDCTFDYFVQVLQGTDDEKMLTDALVGLVHLLDGASDSEGEARVLRLLSVESMESEVNQPPNSHPLVLRLVSFLRRNQSKTLFAGSLRLISAILAVPCNESCDLAIASGVLGILHDVLQDLDNSAEDRCEAAWALSNIAAVGVTQAVRLLDEPGVWASLCGALGRGTPHKVRCECAWAVSHVMRSGNETLVRLEPRRALQMVAAALRVARSADLALQRALLDAADAVLAHERHGKVAKFPDRQAEVGQKKPLSEVAEKCGLLKELEELQHSPSEMVYNKAVHILESWFEADGENEPLGGNAQCRLNKGRVLTAR